jgi:hypothetical protein
MAYGLVGTIGAVKLMPGAGSHTNAGVVLTEGR